MKVIIHGPQLSFYSFHGIYGSHSLPGTVKCIHCCFGINFSLVGYSILKLTSRLSRCFLHTCCASSAWLWSNPGKALHCYFPSSACLKFLSLVAPSPLIPGTLQAMVWVCLLVWTADHRWLSVLDLVLSLYFSSSRDFTASLPSLPSGIPIKQICLASWWVSLNLPLGCVELVHSPLHLIHTWWG